jgi:hypothetical protein
MESAADTAARRSELLAALGATRLAALEAELLGRLPRLVAATARLPLGRQRLVEDLHRSRGSAGSLGMSRLADALGALEHLVESEADAAVVHAATAAMEAAATADHEANGGVKL